MVTDKIIMQYIQCSLKKNRETANLIELLTCIHIADAFHFKLTSEFLISWFCADEVRR